MQAMSLEQIQRVAPSVFATEAHESRGEKYRFFPTINVVEGLIKNGFVPVKAAQSRTRIEGKENFTRHMIRFRHGDLLESARGAEVPEIVLLNSHDGTSSYQLSLGIFRVVCTNGLIVKSAGVAEVRVRHTGRESMIDDVIEGSFEIIKEAPKAIAQIEQWKGITLDRREQEIFAESALELRGTSIEVANDRLLHPRRMEDAGTQQGRDLWKTLNTVQENLIRGGARGRSASGQLNSLRAVKSVDGDTKLNRALWSMSEKMAALKAA